MTDETPARLVPVSSAEESETLGTRIRKARLDARISIREVARQINVSPSFVSQVELGRAAPSIGTLYAIATQLGLSLDALMSPAPSPGSVPAASAPAAKHGPSRGAPMPRPDLLPRQQLASDRPAIAVDNVRWERLTAQTDDLVEFLRITYPPGSESCARQNLQRHEGWEYGHVLEGCLDIEIAFSKGTMAAGDSIDFNSTTPHRLSNPREEECVAIWVVIGRQSRGQLAHQLRQSLSD